MAWKTGVTVPEASSVDIKTELVVPRFVDAELGNCRTVADLSTRIAFEKPITIERGERLSVELRTDGLLQVEVQDVAAVHVNGWSRETFTQELARQLFKCGTIHQEDLEQVVSMLSNIFYGRT